MKHIYKIDTYFQTHTGNNIYENINWIQDEVKLIVCHSFKLADYYDGEGVYVNPGKILYARNKDILKKDVFAVSLTPKSDKLYILSKDEIFTYTIPLKNNIIVFTLKRFHKNLFDNKILKVETIFDLNNIQENFISNENMLKILRLLKELISLEEGFVIDKFFDGLKNILLDMKSMLQSALTIEEKEILLKDTKILFKKLYDTIINIAPLTTPNIRTIDDILKEIELENKKIEDFKKEQQLKLENYKKEYIFKLKAKSELLDAFNS